MRIKLTTPQITALRPYFDRVKAAGAAGSPGMLVAQLTHDSDGTYAMTPAFLDHDVAQVVTQKGREEIPGTLGERKRVPQLRVGRPPDIASGEAE